MNETISIPNKQLARELVKTNASMLQNASITSITIPFIRKTTTSTTATPTPNSNPFFNLNLQSRGEIANNNNNDNNDLTELSWLTNNVQIFNKSTSMNHLSVQHHHHKKSNFYNNNNQPSKVMLTNSASSAFSNYNKLLNSRNNFQYSVNNNKTTKKSSKKIVKHEPIVTNNNNNNNEDDSSYSSSYSSSTSSPLSIQPTTKLSNSYSISPSSSTSSSFSSSSSSSSSNSKKEFKKLNKSNEFYANDMKQDFSKTVSVSSSATAKISITKQQDDLSFNNYTTEFKNSCGMNKPSLTLSCLIFMALQESNEKCLPVREIYEWIEQHFPFYKNVSNGGWKSSIRHNLSFSKCFRKMERNETYFNRPKQTLENNNNKNNDSVENQRKRRAPNSTGTCWTVSSECKSYLVQTLKKSSFWFHNSKNYPNLNEYVVNFSLETTNESTPIRIDDHHFKNSTNLARKNSNKKLKLSANDLLIKPIKNKHLTTNNNNNNTKSDDESDNDNDDDDDDDDNNDLNDQSEEEKQLNLFKFVQKQQEELCKKNYSPNSSFDSNYSSRNNNESLKIRQDLDSNDLAAAAVLASSACSSSASSPKHNNKPKSIVDLSLSSSSSSLSSAFSLLSSHFTSSNQSNELEQHCQNKQQQQQEISSSACLNSDLEMEVASTLVGMKFFARKNN